MMLAASLEACVAKLAAVRPTKPPAAGDQAGTAAVADADVKATGAVQPGASSSLCHIDIDKGGP